MSLRKTQSGSLLSVSIINVLRSQSLPGTDFKEPRDVLKSLNIAFPGEEHNDMYFTIWFGIFDNISRKLRFSSGGHPPAILIHNCNSDCTRVTLLKTLNPVVGGMQDFTYETRETLINKNAKLYVFSDGTYEIQKKMDRCGALKIL